MEKNLTWTETNCGRRQHRAPTNFLNPHQGWVCVGLRCCCTLIYTSLYGYSACQRMWQRLTDYSFGYIVQLSVSWWHSWPSEKRYFETFEKDFDEYVFGQNLKHFLASDAAEVTDHVSLIKIYRNRPACHENAQKISCHSILDKLHFIMFRSKRCLRHLRSRSVPIEPETQMARNTSVTFVGNRARYLTSFQPKSSTRNFEILHWRFRGFSFGLDQGVCWKG